MNDLKVFGNADICTCKAEGLADLRNVSINRTMPLKRRTNDFVAQVGNPYLFKVGDIIVKAEFGGSGDFSEMLTDIILAG